MANLAFFSNTAGLLVQSGWPVSWQPTLSMSPPPSSMYSLGPTLQLAGQLVAPACQGACIVINQHVA